MMKMAEMMIEPVDVWWKIREWFETRVLLLTRWCSQIFYRSDSRVSTAVFCQGVELARGINFKKKRITAYVGYTEKSTLKVN